MAESAVSFLLEKIVPLLQQEVTLLKGVRGEVRYIIDELESMRAFLSVADARSEGDKELKAWVKQVRDLAYDTEDVLDEFLLHLAQHRGHGFFGFIGKIARNSTTLKVRHQIATDIQEIKTRVKDISDRRQRYNHYNQEQGSSSSTINKTWHDPRGDALLLEEAELVGIGKPRDELIELLAKKESCLRVLAVVGMAGLGKTTIVKKVFDDPKVKQLFIYQAWITVSQTFKIEVLLRDMINQLFNANKQPVPRGLDTMEETALKNVLKDFLQQPNRYLVVLDDIWNIHAWDELKFAFPDNNFGSRVMITTRFNDVAKYCGYPYPLDPLQPKEAWALFCKKAFKLNTQNSCPPPLEKLSQDMLRRCEGLPLAIVAIGGLLSTKEQTQMEWESVQRSLSVELERGEELKGLNKMLLLSYNDLPYFLKSCVLYLSIYPEDYTIERMRLIRSWIAEGFIEKRDGMTLEEIAEGYFNQLINRSLIQVVEVDIRGRVRECQIHDLMHDLLVIKSREENFSLLTSEQNASSNEKPRRLSIRNRGENVSNYTCLSTVRSLFIFGMDELSNSSVLLTCFSEFKLLKVLDLRGAPLDNFPSEIVNMWHLKYLSLRSTNVKEVPKSLGRLQNLETLDLKHTHVSELPKEVLKIRQLRHLLVYHYVMETMYSTFDTVQGFKFLGGIGGLVALQKLAYVEASHGTGIITELGRLTKLIRLGIKRLRREDGPELCASVAKMSRLLSFSVTSSDENELLDLRLLSSPPPLLENLYIEGRLEELPNWCHSLHNLFRIDLRRSKMKVDPTKALQALPSLVELGLVDAYEGEKLCFLAGGFQRLKILYLDKLEGLQLMKVEEGAMPHLQKLDISRCGALKKVPLGIEGLNNLKTFHFGEMPLEFVTSIMPKEGEDRWRVLHIPDIRYTYQRDGRWWYRNL